MVRTKGKIFPLLKDCMFVSHRLRAGICWREERRKMRKEGFGEGGNGLDHGVRQRVAVESRRDTIDAEKDIQTHVATESFRG